MNALTFVKELELVTNFEKGFELKKSTSFTRDFEIKDEQQASYVNAGSLVAFEQGVTTQHQEDFLNSILLAQLAADKKFDRNEKPVEWYNFYGRVLTNIGWPAGNIEFAKYETNGTKVEVDKVIIEILTALAGGVASAAILATIKALGDLPNDDRKLVVFSKSSQRSKATNFQISRVVETNGTVQVNLGMIYFTSDQTQIRFLWFGFDSAKIDIYKGGQNILLDDQVYGGVRAAVREKLGKLSSNFVAKLDI